MAAGRTVPADRGGALAALLLPAAGRPAGGDPLRGRPDPRRAVVHDPPRGRLAAPQGRGRRDLRPHRGLPRRRAPVAEHCLPMPDVPRPTPCPGRRDRGPARRRRRLDGGDGPGRGAAVPRGPVRGAAQVAAGHQDPHLVPGRRRAARRPRGARRRADVRQRPDAAVGRLRPARAAGGPTSWAPASTTPSGSTGRCGPTTGSSTRPTARRPPRAGRCASGRSGPPTAPTWPPSPRRGSSGPQKD